MGIALEIDFDVVKAAGFTDAIKKQLPFATSLAINNTSKDLKDAFNESTKGAFHNPVRFTQNAFKAGKPIATKRRLIRVVHAIDEEGKDRARYLRFGTAGGTRPQKGYERYFGKGVPNDGSIPSGSYFVPGPSVKINASGNVSLANIKKISTGISGKARGGFFIGTPRGGNRPPGIYRRSRKQLHPYFIATQNKPDYKKRFDLQKIGNKVIERRFSKYFWAALDQAMATAK